MMQPCQNFGHLVVDDLARQAFGDGGLADAGIADEERIVLLAAAENLDGAFDFGGAPDQRIDLAGLGLLVEVDAIGLQRLGALLGLLLGLFLFLERRAAAWAGSCRAAWRSHG